MIDNNLAATAMDTTTRILILQAGAILTALFAALTTVLVVKVNHLKISKALGKILAKVYHIT
jgi:hypothetical protein